MKHYKLVVGKLYTGYTSDRRVIYGMYMDDKHALPCFLTKSGLVYLDGYWLYDFVENK